MVLAITGHRPPALYGYDLNHPLYAVLRASVVAAIRDLSPSACISGMALGADTIFAQAALDLDIPLIAHIPGDPTAQASRWPIASRRTHADILSRASQTILVPHGRTYVATLLARNDSMVAAADHILAIWDGSTTGGTAHCVRAARAADLPVTILDPHAGG